jgi:BirA family biotin operon repressor/biotin-[acetyl-CoA-carboxylase] ligase
MDVSRRLEATWIGHPVRHLVSVDSTNREAERWALEGAPEGALVVAEHQTAGRGRLGRSWFDLPGKSLLFSLVLRPPLAAAQAATLTYVAAIALADAICRWIPGDRIEIKWPNDVLVDRRRGAGILLEMRCESRRVEHVILGVGINIAGDPAEFPDEIRSTCTAMGALCPTPVDRATALCAFLGEFETRYGEYLQDGFRALVPRWNRWFRAAGQWLRVQTPAGLVEGRARGLSPNGALILEAGGATIEVLAGDVEWSTTREA